ncbi:MAG: hypothetical protein K2L01_04295, partial [Rikenellaceae bacterium]|nr:hypothetical protein [Rikenellaceae bacterium]
MESLAIPHKTSYLHLPFAGKTQVEVVSGERPEVKIKLARINSSIRIENRSADRMELTHVTVNGLPSRGNIFATATEASGVTYTESAEAEIDADGNAVVYSFMVPESEIANLKIEAKAAVENATSEATTIAPLSFIGKLETGKQATALVGYLESGGLKIGTPDNWGNVGRCEFSGGVQLQVVGGEFFDYKSIKALRAYSGGSNFSFIVSAADGVATLSPVGTVDWLTIRDNIITVSPNSGAGRECQINVSVGGKNVGVFYIVQSKAITFVGLNGVVVSDNRVEQIGGTGSSALVSTVSFDVDDDEFDGLEIRARDNGTNGVTVDIDLDGKTLKCHFLSLVDASVVADDGVSVPVEFVDINGTVQAVVTFMQRPAKIRFNPVRYNNISYEGGTVTAVVTVEDDYDWNVRNTTEQSADINSGSLSWLPRPTTNFKSGNNLTLTVAP